MKQQRKRFWGLHFDFHASNDVHIGERTNQEDIEWYLREARPDFVQCDSKGHPGNSSYPTTVGKAAEHLHTDNLRIWCDTVHKHGLPIYVHYSGVIDDEYTKKHPEDAQRHDNGVATNRISLFGNYVDELLIPQVKEMIDNYAIDGLWVDGDCWAVCRDYSDLAKPFLHEDITIYEHNMVMRKAFLSYVKKYVDELHAYAPNFKVTSNWAYTSYIPEKPEVDIDFISGDYPPSDSVHVARYEGRCIAAQNKPWDLMCWSFELSRWVEKPAVQIMQEAAVVLSLGGGFQLYITQNKDGSARRTCGSRYRKIGTFVREREFLFEKKTVAQVGIFYSAESYYRKSNIFNAAGATEALIGTLNCVLDAQYTANVVLEYQIDTLGEYDIVIVPQWEYISDENKQHLLDYAQKGGNLVIVGTECCMQFGKKNGHVFQKCKECCDIGKTDIMDETQGVYLLDDEDNFGGMNTSLVDLIKGEESLYFNNDLRDFSVPAYRKESCGEGNLLYVPFDLGDVYFATRTCMVRQYMQKILRKLAKPVIEINQKNIDITIQKGDKQTYINLINMNQGRHSQEILVYDTIPSLYNVEVVIRGQYSEVKMPLGETFECVHGKDSVKVIVKELSIHSVIELCE